MRWIAALTLLLGCVVAADPASAATHNAIVGTKILFNSFEQAHPSTAVLAIPIMEPIAGIDGGPLSFQALYINRLSLEDPRNSRGKVIMKVKVLRDDRVVWKQKRRDKVRNDWYAERYCGNCTHKLKICNMFDGDLLKGDVLVFNFAFRGFPLFYDGERAEVGVQFGGVVDLCEEGTEQAR